MVFGRRTALAGGAARPIPFPQEPVAVGLRMALERNPAYVSCAGGADGAKVDLAVAKAELKALGYKGEPVIILEVAGSISQTASRVLVQNMRDVGFTVDQQPRDWPTVLARRAKKDGWSMFRVCSNGTDMYSPPTHFYVAATCNDLPGWSCDNRVPEFLKAFKRAATLHERKKIAAEV